jgi:hypothetical protein
LSNSKKEKRKMQIKNKLFTATAILLLLTMIIPIASLPTTSADATEIPTFLLLNVGPNPIGVGQDAQVNAFMSKPPMTAGLGGSGTMFKNIKIEVTKPDGSKATLGPYTSDSTGGIWTKFTPEQSGNYTFKATYPGQHVEEYVTSMFGGPPTFYNLTYLASTSDEFTLVVQDEKIPMYSPPALPTEYWSRPIYSTNYNWAQLGGSWYGLAAPAFATTGNYDAAGNFQPYSTAPNTGHIMWVQPTHFGGQPGLPIPNDQMSQYMSTTIATNFFEPVILNGVLYYTEYAGPNAAKASWKAVDIRTGETLWTRSAGEAGNEVIRMGQILRYHSIQEFGSWAFLYGCDSAGFFGTPSHFSIYDAKTGEYMANITGVQNVGFLMDTDPNAESPGSLLAYYTDAGNLTLWNSTKLMMANSGDKITIRPTGTYNWSQGIQWSVQIPTKIGDKTISGSLSIAARTPDVILLRYAPSPGMFSALSYGYQTTAGINAKTGALLWGPKNQTIPNLHDVSLLAAGEGAYVLHDKDTNEAYGYSLTTGDQIWGPVKLPGNAWSHLSRAAQVAYGKFYIFDFGGYVNALNASTGNIEWTFTPRSAGYNTGYGIYPLWYNGMISDGKLFISESHMYDPPVYAGAQQLAINCSTGKLVWSILSFTGRVPTASADGYLIQWNSYDSQIYSIGKGPTSTTIAASPKVSEQGSSVLVEGMVIDTSAGTKDSDRSVRFPNGVPAIADEYMSPWMEYVYMQQPKPTNATGVKVTVSVLDPNGNTYDVGTTTSDSNGFYKLAFTPKVAGEYTVIASFGGSESYWPSQARTAIDVTDVEPTATPYPVVTLPPTETYFAISTVAIILAIAIVGVLLLRKKT